MKLEGFNPYEVRIVVTRSDLETLFAKLNGDIPSPSGANTIVCVTNYGGNGKCIFLRAEED